MKTSELYYELPPELIAQQPIEPRDASRLLVIHRDTGTLEHRIFRDIGAYLRPGDLLIANESRVIPARLYARKEPGGGKVEVLLLRALDENTWLALVGGARTRTGTRLRFLNGEALTDLTAEVIASGERGERTLHFASDLNAYLETIGHVPLPPYIREPLADPERYQTVYAQTPGSAAAPTAGLHFTPELLFQLRAQGVNLDFVTLHVGLDTFRPIEEEEVEAHQIHSEWCRLSYETAERINRVKLEGGRIIAVGTTSLRILETAAQQGLCQDPEGRCPWRAVAPFEGFTRLYVTPGYRFRVVDALITNFHLPHSTLLALVMAFAGVDLIRKAYAEAIRERYRFFSFGDASLIL